MKSLFLGYASAAQPHKPIIFLSSHSCSRQAVVRQMVRQMSNCHKSLRFAIYCAAYGTERLFSLALFYPFYYTYFFVSYIPLFEIWHRNHMPAKPNVGAKIQTAVSEKEIGTIERKTTTSILYVY